MTSEEPSFDEHDDELARLMTSYQGGDRAAFEALYERLAPEVGRYFGAILHDADRAADLTQECFLEVHRSRRLYLPPLPVRPWLFGIARNVLRRYWRHERRRARERHAPLESPIGGANASAVAQDTVTRIDLERALENLPAGRRQAWWLHHVQGWSFEQIGRRFGMSTGAAKLRSSRAMRALRKLLAADSEGR